MNTDETFHSPSQHSNPAEPEPSVFQVCVSNGMDASYQKGCAFCNAFYRRVTNTPPLHHSIS